MADNPLPTVEDIYAIREAIVDEYDLEHPGTRASFPDDKLARVIDRVAERADVFEQAAVFLKGLSACTASRTATSGRCG